MCTIKKKGKMENKRKERKSKEVRIKREEDNNGEDCSNRCKECMEKGNLRGYPKFPKPMKFTFYLQNMKENKERETRFS